MSRRSWACHPVLWWLNVSLSVWAVGYHVRLIVKAGTCANWLGESTYPSEHVRETYLRICFYEAYKNPSLSLAQLPPWLIYVAKFTLHCSIGEAGIWPGVWVCEWLCLWVCVWQLPCVEGQIYMIYVYGWKSRQVRICECISMLDLKTLYWRANRPVSNLKIE